MRPRGLGLAVFALVGACAFDWDGYDPRKAPTAECGSGETRSCYDGPEGTADVGVCRSGTQRCGADGTFGACLEQVLPGDEQCGTLDDEDCDGTNLDGDAGCVCEAGQFGACYQGPAGTEGTGQCLAGQGQCDVSGTMTIGNCVAQVLPFNEECTTLADDDCDGTSNDYCASWSQRFGDEALQSASGLALDANGGVVITGQMAGLVDFGGGQLDGVGIPDIFIAKFDALTGAHQWSRNFSGGTPDAGGNAVVVDGNGDVIVAGYFAADVTWGPPVGTIVSLGGYDAFVAKFDGATANTLWVYVAGGTTDAEALDVAVDAAGNVTAVGRFLGSIDFGNGVETATGTDGFVVHLDSAGVPQWQLALGGSGIDAVHAVAATPAGDIALAGEFASSIDLGGGALTASAANDGFVASLDAAGAHQWSKALSGAGVVVANRLAVDATGNVRVGGWFDTDVDLAGATATSAGGDDAFVLALDATGARQWDAVYGDADDQQCTSLSVGPNGEVLLGMALRGSVQVGNMPVYAVGGSDWLLVAHDAAGAPAFARRFGDEYDDLLHGAAMAADGSILVVGDVTDDMDLGAGNSSGDASVEDIVLGRLAP